MSMLDRFEAQLKVRGLRVSRGSKPGELVLSGPKTEVTPELMDALKKFKPALLAKYAPPVEQPKPEPKPEPKPTHQECRQCNRDVSNAEDRERLVGVNPFCTEPHCPYRGNGSSTHS